MEHMGFLFFNSLVTLACFLGSEKENADLFSYFDIINDPIFVHYYIFIAA